MATSLETNGNHPENEAQQSKYEALLQEAIGIPINLKEMEDAGRLPVFEANVMIGSSLYMSEGLAGQMDKIVAPKYVNRNFSPAVIRFSRRFVEYDFVHRLSGQEIGLKIHTIAIDLKTQCIGFVGEGSNPYNFRSFTRMEPKKQIKNWPLVQEEITHQIDLSRKNNHESKVTFYNIPKGLKTQIPKPLTG